MENEKLALEVYKDIVQPISQQVGITLGEVGKLIFLPIIFEITKARMIKHISNKLHSQTLSERLCVGF